MKTLPHFLVAIGLFASCSGIPDQASLKTEIESVNQEFARAVSNQDVEAVGALYTDDARLMFPNMPAIEGRDKIREFFQQAVIGGGITGLNLITEEVSGTDEFAMEHGRYEMFVGDQQVDGGKYLVHWKKEDGKWRLHRDMPSTDLALPQAAAKPDQTVGIAIFKVKQDNRARFEAFIHEVLHPSADVSTPEKRAGVNAVRFLRGNGPEPDGSHKYIFIFDPRYEGMEYEIEKILVAKHGEERGRELNAEFSALVMPFYEYHDMQQLPLEVR